MTLWARRKARREAERRRVAPFDHDELYYRIRRQPFLIDWAQGTLTRAHLEAIEPEIVQRSIAEECENWQSGERYEPLEQAEPEHRGPRAEVVYVADQAIRALYAEEAAVVAEHALHVAVEDLLDRGDAVEAVVALALAAASQLILRAGDLGSSPAALLEDMRAVVAEEDDAS